MESHHQQHSHTSRAANQQSLALTLGLVSAYMIAEVIGGLLTGSLALLADAGHMLSDAGSLALALFALWIAQKPPTSEHTYGYYRTEILAALANGATLVAVSLYICVEAYERFLEPREIKGGWMLAVAAGGLLVNLAGLWVLRRGRGESLNIRGAWLHVLTDTLGSIQAIAAGALIWAFGWYWADPLASVAIGLLVIFSSWTLLKESVSVLMEGSPGHIDVDEVRETIVKVSGVEEVHDLHVWTITSGLIALSCHVVCAGNFRQEEVLSSVRTSLHEKFHIDHVTIQVELPEHSECRPKV